MNSISRIFYSDELPLMERQQVLYRAFIFNRLLYKMWPDTYNTVLNRKERFIDYFKLSKVIKLNRDKLLSSFFKWLLKTQDEETAYKTCPVFINEELNREAKEYSLSCVSKSLGELGGVNLNLE